MKTTIVIPILYFNNYSVKAIKFIAKLPSFTHLKFMFVVTPWAINKLNEIVMEMENPYQTIVCDTTSSNELRLMAKFADTEYIYYHDCDDVADYEFINDFTKTLDNCDIVHVFNVTKVLLNSENQEIGRYNIYKGKDGKVQDIQILSQNVYSKFIPTKYIKSIDFPNLPFTQDWAISYSLYLNATHINHKRSTYTYFFYPSSSSKPIHDSKFRLLRVTAYSKIIVKKYKEQGLIKESEILRLLYDIVLSNRFASIGITYRIGFPSLKTFCAMNFEKKRSFIYQYLKFVNRLIKF